MTMVRIELQLHDQERVALNGLCDAHYASLSAIVQFLACSAASYMLIARGDLDNAHLLARAAHRAQEI